MGMTESDDSRVPGRRPSTTRASIVAVALRLFARQGYDTTSVDEIAEAAHISRRTLFRYFPGKAAIAWGEFDVQMDGMRRHFAEIPGATPLRDALADSLVAFNTFPDSETQVHRLRMGLLLGVDELQAHSTLIYADWRRAVAEFVAARRGETVHDLIPAATAHAALGIADLDAPDYGESVRLEPGDVPVFWACGVTPQAAIAASRPPYAITHAPGHMAITDARDSDYLVP